MTILDQVRPVAFRDFSHGALTLIATVSSSVLGIADLTNYDQTKLGLAARATISAITNGVNFTYDGTTDPTDVIGHPIGAGQSVVIVGTANINQLRFIRSGSDASLTVTVEVSP